MRVRDAPRPRQTAWYCHLGKYDRAWIASLRSYLGISIFSIPENDG